MNNYYASPPDLAPGTRARAGDINTISQSVNAAFDKLPVELALKSGTVNYAANSSNTANAYTVSLAAAITAYTDGLEVKMLPGSDNTGACTLNVNGLGAIAIKRQDGTNPAASELLAACPITLTYVASANLFRLPPVGNSQVAAAAASAKAASDSATAASNSANAASGSANSASNSATSASNSATSASNSATAAANTLANVVHTDTAAQGLSAAQKTNAKTNIDLQNVDNTSDVNKPVSTAQQNALNAKANLSGATFTGAITAPRIVSAFGDKTISSQQAFFGTTDANAMGLGISNSTNTAMEIQSVESNVAYRNLIVNKSGGNVLIGATADDGVGKLQVGGNITVQNQSTGAARAQFANTGGTFYVGLDNSVGGLGGAYSANIWHSGAYPIVFATSGTERARVDPSGNLLVGVTSGTYNNIRKNVTEGVIVAGFAGTTAGGMYVCRADVSGYNATNSAVLVDKNSTSSRSINAAGTINASGADYAEYMTKAATCGEIAKGAIVGVNADGRLTDKFAEAVSFLIKSTDPSYVGGDVWGSEAALGSTRPTEPQFVAPEYTGTANPGEAPAVLPAPAASASKEELAAYDTALQQYQTVKAAYDAALTKYNADWQAHTNDVQAARNQFDTVTMPTYQSALTSFDAKLEAARQKVDRIAYCGQVPCNVLGAKPGQYVVPAQDANGGITGVLVPAADMTLAWYMSAVGIVQNILPDGRANVRVKPV